MRLREKFIMASKVKTTIAVGIRSVPDWPSPVILICLGSENSSSLKDSMAKKPLTASAT